MLKTTILALTTVLSLGGGASALAQTAPPAPPARHAAPTAVTKPADQQPQLIKPGDRNCLRSTGSLIPAKKGQCLQGVFGRSYSAQELRNAGQQNTADALRMLDPAIH